jgi:hypothetical protein
MDKQNRKKLKKQYLESENQKFLQKVREYSGDSPFWKIQKLLYSAADQEITEEFILTAAEEKLELALVAKINEEVDMLRTKHKNIEGDAQLMLTTFKRMVIFTNIFEGYVAVGDMDKYIRNSLPFEIDETINAYQMIGQKELASLLNEARDTSQIESTRLYAYFEQEGKLDNLVSQKIVFIRQNAREFL